MAEQRVPFFKMQGSGNDFVVIDNRSLKVPVAVMAEWARKICRRAFGVGADGLFFLEEAPDQGGVDFRWHFYNADGSRAEMCGNGSRCAAWLAVELGMAPARHAIGTDAGVVRAEVYKDQGRVKVELTPPTDMRRDIRLDIAGTAHTAQFVNTGVPHAVLFVDDVAAVDLKGLGHAVRFHPEFAPKGTNANFAQVLDKKTMLLRTYERGVEDETFACGTGASAAAYLANAMGLTGPEVDVTTSGGEKLTITVDAGKVFLTGAATIVFAGELRLGSVGLSL